MYSFHFNIKPLGCQIDQDCIIHIDEGIYYVHIEGVFIGSMIRDADFFTTDSPELKALLPDILPHISKVLSRSNFHVTLKEMFNVIIRAEYTDEETIMITVRTDTCLQEFASAIQDTIYDFIDFKERINLVISKKGFDEVVIVEVN
ncbi:hypothetical protein ACJVDH_00485 [Pedobacter sp. AW1-32]|uniref:hypothetical protein n=1 Tax=Pedobacter sp. AW1-32 TaxID=3383026 RepID=UPI003FF0A985